MQHLAWSICYSFFLMYFIGSKNTFLILIPIGLAIGQYQYKVWIQKNPINYNEKPFSVYFFSNFLIAYRTIKTSIKSKVFQVRKTELNSLLILIAAIFLPGSCYSAKADFRSSSSTEKQFSTFSKNNAYIFIAVCKWI